MHANESPNGEVLIRLSKDEALVLFEWLSRTEGEDEDQDDHDLARLGFVDQAEQRVLWDLNASLESVLAEPFLTEYDQIIDAARSRLRDSE